MVTSLADFPFVAWPPFLGKVTANPMHHLCQSGRLPCMRGTERLIFFLRTLSEQVFKNDRAIENIDRRVGFRVHLPWKYSIPANSAQKTIEKTIF